VAEYDFFLRPDWPAPPQVHAAQSLRTGGVSTGAFASLNIGTNVGDDANAVRENRAILRRALALPGEPQWLSQVHGAQVVDADKDDYKDDPRDNDTDVSRNGDAVITRRPGIVCVIQTADCLPVLFTNATGTSVAAAHAGWRGLAAGVLEGTVRAFGEPARELRAWFGPAIGRESFEVGDEVRETFVAHDKGAAGAFVGNARGRWMADLFLLARQRLATLGVTRIYGGGLSTAADPARFFSHRRDGHSGRMATLIWLEA
jgi:YfiH family protein